MEWLSDPQAWIGFVTLAVLEIVLGIDNVVFISILAGKLPAEQRARARRLGLGMAMVMRILMLLGISWIVRLTAPLFTVLGQEISGRDLVLLIGGLFLLGKATHEIHDKLEGEEGEASARVAPSFASVIVQITLLDIVFSLDSVITAVGMVQQVGVMIAAVIVAVAFMMLFAGAISGFVERHPTVKMLALSFLLMIGVMLIAEGFGHHIPKGYVYFSMAFSVFVEALNIRLRKVSRPVHLHQPYTPATGEGGGQALSGPDDGFGVEIFLIGVLLLLNGFFAGAEIAVLTARRGRIQTLADRDRRAAALLRLKADPDRFMATVQIGVTVVVDPGLGGGRGGGHRAAGALVRLHPMALGAATGRAARRRGGGVHHRVPVPGGRRAAAQVAGGPVRGSDRPAGGAAHRADEPGDPARDRGAHRLFRPLPAARRAQGRGAAQRVPHPG